MARKAKSPFSDMSLVGIGIPTFLKQPYLPPEKNALRKAGAKAAFLGVPYDRTNLYRTGSELGPRGIRCSSEQYGTYLMDFDLDLEDCYGLVDCGDVPVVTDVVEAHRRTQATVSEILAADAVPLIAGGDHSIPIPCAKALSKRTKGKMGYLHFDAHMDNEPEYGGDLFTNSTHVVRALELRNVRARNVASVGIHGYMNWKEDMALLRNQGHTIFRMEEIVERGIEDVMKEALDIVWDGTDAVYVTIDTDVVDGCMSPGTTAPEPGGLTPREFLKAMRITGERGFDAADVCEYCPDSDIGGAGLRGGVTGRLVCYAFMTLLGARGR